MKKKVLIMVFAAFMALSLAACGETEANTDQQEQQREEQTEQQTDPEKTDAGAVGDYDVTIGDCAFTSDIDGNKTIIVNYDFTNNSDDTIAPFIALDMKAYQDGVSLEIAFVMDADVYDAGIGQKEIKPGASITGCQNAYVLTSNSPVEVEVGTLFGDPVLFKTFDVA